MDSDRQTDESQMQLIALNLYISYSDFRTRDLLITSQTPKGTS